MVEKTAASQQEVRLLREPREGGHRAEMGQSSQDSDASADYQDEGSQVAAIRSLGADLEALGDLPFAAVLQDVQAPLIKTKAGLAPADSPLTYQQWGRQHNFKVWMATVAPGVGTSCTVPRLELFAGAVQHTFPGSFTSDEQRILMQLQVSAEDAQELEQNSRQQSHSSHWRDGRRHRLTASHFGRVIKRNEWTETGLRNLTEPKDLSRVRAVQYGIGKESVAADCYENVMQSHGHNVTLHHSGLAVNPAFPWLGASPDRFVYDPEELTYGVLEIKCPYSLEG
ncbi:hypothetical protein MTO96_041654 [Rhipicephalus appendiculatus]